MAIRAARLENSVRLQAVFWALAGGDELSTLDLVEKTKRCAINSAVDELRDFERTDNGLDIVCKYHDGAHHYRMNLDGRARYWKKRLSQ